MRSAVVSASKKANGEEEQANGTSSGSGEESNTRTETEGAVVERGKAYLKGNPLQTTKEILCPDCGLPRLLYPLAGAGARPSPDPSKQYCKNHPIVRRPGHDVHGNLFATDKPPSKKKKQGPASDTPGSSPPTTPDGSSKLDATDRPSFPTVKCPVCPRYHPSPKFTYYLDRCMGISGRQASRNKNNAENDTTTTGSAKRPLPEDDTPPTPSKKKKANPKKPAVKPASKLKNGITPAEAADSDDGEKSDEDTHA